jgi:hypothetical protein
VLALTEAAGAAVTQYNAHGTTLLDGNKVFPIVLAKGPERGALTPTDSDAVDEVVGAGVNFLKVGPATDPWTDADVLDALAWNREAAERGVHTWINLATLSTSQPPGARLREVVTALKTGAFSEAIGMWKGADEPRWVGTEPVELQFAYCLSTDRGDPAWCAGEEPVDSDHLWVTIQAARGTAEQLAPYSEVTDIHGVDHYPVTRANPDPDDLNEVGQWTNTIASITPNHAVWTTLQVCASGSGDGETFVLPTRLQERYMIYDAIINGARSLAFYGGNIFRCWDDRDDLLLWNWRFWDDVLKGLIQEINAVSPMAPALVSPETTQVLPSSDLSTQVIRRRGATSEDIWVIAARSGAGSQPVTISGLPAGISTGSVYTEGRSVAVANGSFTDTFERWGVHVYHFRDEPPPSPPPAPPAPPPAPPPAAHPPPPAAPAAPAPRVASRLLSTRLQTIPALARAGRVFTVRMRVATDLGTPVRSGTIRCAARVGKSSLRPIAKRWKNGYATCTWRLPKTARGKKLAASVRVVNSGLALTRRVSRRVS